MENIHPRILRRGDGRGKAGVGYPFLRMAMPKERRSDATLSPVGNQTRRDVPGGAHVLKESTAELQRQKTVAIRESGPNTHFRGGEGDFDDTGLSEARPDVRYSGRGRCRISFGRCHRRS